MASAGSPSPRDEILRKLRERIVGFAASKMGREDAEDIAQETLILLHVQNAGVAPQIFA